MAREIKAVMELTKAQMEELWASLNDPENTERARKANQRAMKIRFNVL